MALAHLRPAKTKDFCFGVYGIGRTTFIPCDQLCCQFAFSFNSNTNFKKIRRMKNLPFIILFVLITAAVKGQILKPVSWHYLAKKTSPTEATLLIKNGV